MSSAGRRGLAVASLACILIAGCATDRPAAADALTSARSTLAQTPPCCPSLSGAPRVALPLEAADIEINQSRPVFEFDGQKAYFVMFELPAFTQPYAILVESVAFVMDTTFGGGGALGLGATQERGILVPVVETLNASFEPVRVFAADSLRTRSDNLERTVFINAPNADERYLLVRGAAREDVVEDLRPTVTYSSVYAGGGVGMIALGADVPLRIRHAPTGTVRIVVSGLPAKR